MAATELTDGTTTTSASHRSAELRPRPVGYTLAALIVATALAGALEIVDRKLFISVPPHPTLHPTAQAIASIFTTNLRVLAAPFLLIAFGFHCTRAGRATGDLIIAAILSANALQIGLAIGRWQTRLVAYLPHLPLEYTALALAAGAWLSARQHGQHTRPHELRVTAVYAASATVLMLAAAVVEALLTPHAR
jgi:Stage II sporulation protein M